MPSLTLQQSTSDTQRAETGQSTSRSRDSSPEPRREPQRESSSPTEKSTSQPEQPTERDLTERIEQAPTKSATSGREPTTETPESGAGRETSTLYPDLTVKTLAPRIDVTRRDITHESEQTGGSEREQSDLTVEGLSQGRDIEQSPYQADIDRMAERLYREIERKRRIDRERRGL